MNSIYKMIKYLFSISIIFFGLISCQSEIQCNEVPDISVEEELLDAQISEIERYLEAEGIEFQTHSSGIRYSVLEEGIGNPPNFCSTVSIDFEGRVLGSEETFTSGIGTQLSLRANQTVPGFKIAVSLMNRGADYRMFVPAQLLINRGVSEVVPQNIPDGENIEFRIRLNNY